MKKFLFIILSLIFVSRLYAHEIKFMLGGNLSKYEISPEVYYDSVLGDNYTYEISSKKGFLLGAGIEFNLTRNISFEIDALYLQKGTEVQKLYSLIEIGIFPQKYTLHVINIPVLLKIKFLRSSSPYIFGGHELSFILSHGFRSFFNGGTGDFMSITESTETFESGLIYGGGFEIKLKKTTFFIEARFLNGLNNIIKNQIDWETAETTSVSLILGFKI
ncbi:MAG: porin family protein [Promethearchaeota archaeon]